MEDSKRETISERASAIRWAEGNLLDLILIVLITGLMGTHAFSQSFDNNLAFPQYQNRLYVPSPTNTVGGSNAQSKAVAFFNGNVSSILNTSTPHWTSSGGITNFLAVSSFAQPVQTLPPIKADYRLGDQITNAFGGIVTDATFDNTNNAFFVAGPNIVYACGAGFVVITWHFADGSTAKQTNYISANSVSVPQLLYWTDADANLTNLTGAPFVDLSPVSVVLHPNSDLPAGNVFTNNNKLRARADNNRAGRMVLEYHNKTNALFLGVQIVEVKPYNPENIIPVDVGRFLPVPHATNQLRPLVSRGLSDTAGNPHFVFQIYAPGDAHDGDIFPTRPTPATPGNDFLLTETNIEVFSFQLGSQNIIWPFRMDRFQARWPTNFSQIAQRIYHTHGPDYRLTKAPPVSLPIAQVTIHWNTNIPPDVPDTDGNPHSSFWQDKNIGALFARQLGTTNIGPILLHYDNGGLPGFIGVEYVDVRPYSPDTNEDVNVGDHLLPRIPNLEFAPPLPQVTAGATNNPYWVYQHVVNVSEGSPMYGYLFSVHTNALFTDMEVFWMKHGFVIPTMVWPYEMHRYRSAWPSSRPDKYQVYIRGEPPTLGPDVAIPSTLSATLMPFQEPAHHANDIVNNSFSSTNAGWSLLKYTSGELVDFQVVRSVLHDVTDPTFATNIFLTPTNWPIGTEITDAYHQGSRAPYIYTNNAPGPHSWDRYDWEVYDGKPNDPSDYLTKQIFAVNTGTLEVWYSNLKTNIGQTIQWPSLAKRYNNQWPTSPETIIIASQIGTGGFNPGTYQNPRVYYQNDPNRPGFNPNDEHAFSGPAAGGANPVIYALRCDLGTNSEPYVLVRSQLPANNYLWGYRVFHVVAEQGSVRFNYPRPLLAMPAEVAVIDLPFPLSAVMNYTFESYPDMNGPYWKSRENRYFPSQAGDDGGTTNLVMHFFYEVKSNSFGFYFPDNNFGNGTADGAHVPWLDRYARTPGKPVGVTNILSWPTNAPSLFIGETLVGPKHDLDDISSQGSVEIVYQQAQALSHGSAFSVQVIEPTATRTADLDSLPTDVKTNTSDGLVYLPDLPPHLRSRLWWNPSTKQLNFQGQYVVPPAGSEDYYLLLNELTSRDRDAVLALTQNPGLLSQALTGLMAPPRVINPNDPFTPPLALTAGAATGAGFVTLAYQNNSNLHDPIRVRILQVSCPVYRGELKVINSGNPFDEKLTMRHSGDFDGKAEQYVFDWRVADPLNGLQPPPTFIDTNGFPQYEGWNTYLPHTNGALDVTIGGAGIATLSDHYFVCRYYPTNTANPCGTNWSAWTSPQLQEGWIKRVLDAINPFDQRVTDYANSQVDTIVSMIAQAGARSVGNVPLNQQAANSFGLIEIYETILNHGLSLNASGTPAGGYPPVNDALLLAAGRIADLYMLLGNEAYADAEDPTIAYGTDDRQYGQFATSVHCFENQTASLLEEELALLRGRDNSLLPDVSTYPTYNRLIWNFTHDIAGGEVAYALNYDIKDVSGPNGVPDGVIDAYDGKAMYPQGHGDAWGHYLSAIKNYYKLLRSDHFTWVPRIESVLVGGVPVSVDYLDERKFAQAAGAKARTGAEIVNLTYRNAYVEDPQGQWQGYTDTDTNRAWGVSEWASRAGQGAYYDWVVANAMLPPSYTPGYKMTQNTLDQVGNASIYVLTDDVITNRIPVAAIGIPATILAELISFTNRQFTSRTNFVAVLDSDSVIGPSNRKLYQGAILGQSQTDGLPEGAYEVLDIMKGHIYPSLTNLEAALSDTNVLGPTLFAQYYPTLIRPNLEVPPTNGNVTGIQKIDRTTVSELSAIASAFLNVQEQVDKADSGLNPLGLSKNAVPFDIDPTLVSQGKTHFEQIYDRAVQALNNAIVVFNHANDSTQLLRRQADTLADFQKTVENQEADFTNRLIEIFGYPYPEDIGAGGTYPDGYEGPDTEAFHFNYIDSFDLTGVTPPTTTTITRVFSSLSYDTNGALVPIVTNVTINLSTEGLSFQKPPNWTRRRATGAIQKALADLLQARVRFKRSLTEYDNLIGQIEDQVNLLNSQYDINAAELEILNQGRLTQIGLNDQIAKLRRAELTWQALTSQANSIADALAEFLPTDVGTSDDVTSAGRGAIKLAGALTAALGTGEADAAALAELDVQQAKEDAQALTNIKLTTLHQELPILQAVAQIEQLVRQEVLSRLDLYSQLETMQQAAEAYASTLAQGQRILADRLRFRQQTAAQIQSDRYKDMAFRIFRNDALQKYRAQFDLAATYVYLAARTYDYETNLRTNDNRGPGQKFMTDIIRSQSLGLIQNGLPVVGNGVGDAGLADPMARMNADWNLVLKGQLGFNNPETETGRFSLRSELFRVTTNSSTASANSNWRAVLSRSVVSNLFSVPEFQRYCIPFTPSQPVEPGFVIPFSTTINFAQNFFGWPLGGGDNAYDSSHFATKIRSVGVWFANYNNTTLANQPRVYLIPVGSDVMTSPPRFPGDFPLSREWKVTDQELPVPFPLSDGDITDQTYIPINDSLIGDYADIRKYASFRAYHDSGNFDPSQTITASRLIGRSVWNNQWLLIIPAGTLLSDRNEAIQRFIYGTLQPDGSRNNNGVTDIKIFFQTYSYAGN